jgi:hypothetical protein
MKLYSHTEMWFDYTIVKTEDPALTVSLLHSSFLGGNDLFSTCGKGGLRHLKFSPIYFLMASLRFILHVKCQNSYVHFQIVQ